MKKFLALLLCTVMLLALCACGGVKEEIAEEGQENVGLANPVTEYATLDEVNELLGCRLAHPAAMSVTDEEFSVISGDCQIGEYEFESGDMDYTLRYSAVFDRDISGVYIAGGTAFSDEYSGSIEYVYTDEEKLARWCNVDGQYCLCIDDDGKLTQEQFEAIALEMQDLTNPALVGTALADYYASLEGEYQDSVSQRAMATVVADGENGIKITVAWGSSAFETSMWSMTATRGEDGLLNYTDCAASVIKTADDGAETMDILSTDGTGFFSESDGILFWNGAADENCRSCTFEKMP